MASRNVKFLPRFAKTLKIGARILKLLNIMKSNIKVLLLIQKLFYELQYIRALEFLLSVRGLKIP